MIKVFPRADGLTGKVLLRYKYLTSDEASREHGGKGYNVMEQPV